MNGLLDRFYAALKLLSAEQLADCVSDDFILEWQGSPAIPWAGSWHGVQGLLDFVRVLNEHVQVLDVQRLRQFADTDTCVVLLQGHWRLKASGCEVRAMACNVFAMGDGRIRAYTVLNNTAAFAEALAPR